jgi:hypothetical protein
VSTANIAKICYLFVKSVKFLRPTIPGFWRDKSNSSCRQISEAIGKQQENDAMSTEEHGDPEKKDGMTFAEKMMLWSSLEDVPTPVAPADNPEADNAADGLAEPELGSLNFSSYYEILTSSPAYKWLVSAVQAQLSLTTMSPDRAHPVRQCVLEHTNRSRKIQRRPILDVYQASFEIEVDPLWCLHDQEYSKRPQEVIASMIVLTGSEGNVYATTCLEYLALVWPETGPRILEVIGQALQNPRNTTEECKSFYASLSRPRASANGGKVTFADMTTMSARIDTSLIFFAAGSGHALAEVAEQLAWLAATLSAYRNSGNTTPAYCYPVVRGCTSRPIKLPGEEERRGTTIDCRIDVVLENADANQPGDEKSRCWYNLFWNPVIVKGYPIPRRVHANTGLEISLELMAALTCARRITTWDGRPFIKGHSSMLIPTRDDGDVLLWHLFYNGNGEFISYEDPRVRQAQTELGGAKLRPADLVNRRHVVGWATSVRNCTGNSVPLSTSYVLTYPPLGRDTSNYDIAWSGLRHPPPGSALEKVEIQAGQFITATVGCVIGKKDRALHISNWGDDYLGLIDTMSKRFVLLYDVNDRRAWLVDGASTILHILRASIKSYQGARRFRDHFLLDSSSIDTSDFAIGGQDDAFNVLTNKHNQTLALYNKVQEEWEEETITDLGQREKVKKCKTAAFRLRDRVDQICDILSQMIAHQDDMHPDGVGFRVKASPRRRLEGYDFMDVASNEGRFEPKMAELAATGAGWVDFVRALRAIPLFGSGFGELIQPLKDAKSCGNCDFNVSVPTGKDYLAVCIADLETVLKKRGNTRQTPWRVIEDIYWHAPDQALDPCQCKPQPLKRRDRIQVFLPSSFPKIWGLRSPAKLESGGAVLFGHSWKFPLRWKIGQKAPEQGELDETATTEDEQRAADSGIGSSLSSSGGATELDSPPSAISGQEDMPVTQHGSPELRPHDKPAIASGSKSCPNTMLPVSAIQAAESGRKRSSHQAFGTKLVSRLVKRKT